MDNRLGARAPRRFFMTGAVKDDPRFEKMPALPAALRRRPHGGAERLLRRGRTSENRARLAAPVGRTVPDGRKRRRNRVLLVLHDEVRFLSKLRRQPRRLRRRGGRDAPRGNLSRAAGARRGDARSRHAHALCPADCRGAGRGAEARLFTARRVQLRRLRKRRDSRRAARVRGRVPARPEIF